MESLQGPDRGLAGPLAAARAPTREVYPAERPEMLVEARASVTSGA